MSLRHTHITFAVTLAVLVTPVLLPGAAGAQSGHPDDLYWNRQIGTLSTTDRIHILYSHGADLYVGGGFVSMSGITSPSIARWDGTTWHDVGAGVPGVVYTICIVDGDLYVGGQFQRVGGVTVRNVARWDGARWHDLGGGLLGPSVNALVEFQGSLHAVGSFWDANGVETRGVARWTGQAWEEVGGGLTGYWGDGAAVGGGAAATADWLFIRGSFYYAGSARSRGLAQWDGQSWSALNVFDYYSSAMIRDLAVTTDRLYVGGWMLANVPIRSNHIAMWDGAWHSLGKGTNGQVCGVAVAGEDVYARGTFTRAGGLDARGVARWDGSAWFPLGEGTEPTNTRTEIAVSNAGEVYVDGITRDPNGTVSSYFVARWYNPVPYPTRPIPPNLARDRRHDTVLWWEHSGSPNSPSGYDVYFGTTSNPPLVAAMVPSASFAPTLAFATTYHWRVVARDAQGNHATGPLWRFTTEDTIKSWLYLDSTEAVCGAGDPDTVGIDITLDNLAEPLDAGGLDVAYDPAVLTFLDVARGDLTAEWEVLEAADLGGRIRLGGFGRDAAPAGASGVFARVRFVADCCVLDSTGTKTLCASGLTDDLASLRGTCGEVRCVVVEPDGDVDGDGVVTAGDAFCAFEHYLAYPAAPPTLCSPPGAKFRADVDCSGRVTPIDARCIHAHWLDGSCAFCAGGPPSAARATGRARVALTAGRLDGDLLAVWVHVADPTALSAFGFDLSSPSDRLVYEGAEFGAAFWNFDRAEVVPLGAGALRVGAYGVEAAPVASRNAVVTFYFRAGEALDDVVIQADGFVDDLASASPVRLELGPPRQPITAFRLHQNRPNPFNPVTEVVYEVPDDARGVHVRVEVYSVDGRRVGVLENALRDGGRYSVYWDGHDDHGAVTASGVYFCLMRAGAVTLSRKLVLLR
jgi:hypothetical protein